MDAIDQIKINTYKSSFNGVIKSKDEIKLKEACEGFEQTFVKYLLDKLWSNTGQADNEVNRERTLWQDTFNNEVAKEISKNGSFGISEMLYLQLSSNLGKEDAGQAEIKDAKQEEVNSMSTDLSESP